MYTCNTFKIVVKVYDINIFQLLRLGVPGVKRLLHLFLADRDKGVDDCVEAFAARLAALCMLTSAVRFILKKIKKLGNSIHYIG